MDKKTYGQKINFKKNIFLLNKIENYLRIKTEDIKIYFNIF